MNVTHVIPYMHPRAGGPPVVVDRFCRGLAVHGWNCRVLATDALARGEATDWMEAYRGSYELEVFPSRGPRQFAYSPELAGALLTAVADSDLVHIHTVWTYPNRAAIRACRRAGVPFVVMPHGMLDPHSLARKRFKKAVYARIVEWPQLRSAAGMIYTHAEEQRLAEQSCPRLPHGYVVPLGADEPPNEPRELLAAEFLADWPSLRGRRLIVFLSRLHPKKGLDLLVPAFADITRRHPDTHLLLVGPGDAGYVERIHGWVRELGVSDRVTFTGPLAGRAKWAALAAGSIFALPSYQENFALVVAEALAMGLPVVLSRRVNIWPEVVSAGAGALCELSRNEVAAALDRCLSDPGFLTEAAHRGRQLVAERFNWPRSVSELVHCYEQVLNGARCGVSPPCNDQPSPLNPPLHTT